MNIPNKLTVARCILTFIFFTVLLWDFPYHYAVAMGLFIIASVTDILDGKIARSRGLVTNLGKFLDPLADKTLTTAALLGIIVKLGGDSLCWATMLILTREFMVTSVRLLAAKDGVVVAASLAGKCKTVVQIISIIYMLATMQFCELFAADFPTVCEWAEVAGHVFIWISVALTLISGIQYVWNLRKYLKEE